MSTSHQNDNHPFQKLGAQVLGCGAIGLLVTCLAYVLAGPEAALPGGATNSAQALAATPNAVGWMRLAGWVGVPSDALLAVGAWMLAMQAHRHQAALAGAGWMGLAIAGVVFIAVDAMVAMVLPVVAMVKGIQADWVPVAYAPVRALFDALFTFGAWIAGASALALMWRREGHALCAHWVVWTMKGAGAVCVLSSTAHLVLARGAEAIGPGIALLAVASVGVAWSHVKAANQFVLPNA